jgi:hypothetical protein
MAKFKCVHTGQVYEYFTDHDIESMLEHDEYEYVEEEDAEEAPKPVKTRKGTK